MILLVFQNVFVECSNFNVLATCTKILLPYRVQIRKKNTVSEKKITEVEELK